MITMADFLLKIELPTFLRMTEDTSHAYELLFLMLCSNWKTVRKRAVISRLLGDGRAYRTTPILSRLHVVSSILNTAGMCVCVCHI